MLSTVLSELGTKNEDRAVVFARIRNLINSMGSRENQIVSEFIGNLIHESEADRIIGFRLLSTFMPPSHSIFTYKQISKYMDKLAGYFDHATSECEHNTLLDMFRKILQMDSDDLKLSIEKQLPKLLNIAFKFVNNSEISNCGFQIIEIISYHQGKSFNITNGNAITKICISFLSHPLHYKQAARALAHLSIYDNSDYFMNTWNAFSCELVHLLHALGIFNMSTLKSKQMIDSKFSIHKKQTTAIVATVNSNNEESHSFGLNKALWLERTFKGCCYLLSQVHTQ